MHTLVTGGTGFIGGRLLAALDGPVTVLTRKPAKARGLASGRARVLAWDPETGPPPAEAWQGVDAVVHLAGEPVAGGRWTAARKQRIRESRVMGTRHLVQSLRDLAPANRPRVLVSASAVGWYGDRGDEWLPETAAPGADFLAGVCRDWEQEALAAGDLGLRVACSRTGVVLGPGGGALAKMRTPFRLGLGGRLGHGRQWMPWVHLDDLVGMLLHALHTESLSGPFNAVAPEPVTNAAFTRSLARVLHRPAVFPVPALGLRLLFGEMASVLLASQRTRAVAMQAAGYAWRFRDLDAALRDSLG